MTYIYLLTQVFVEFGEYIKHRDPCVSKLHVPHVKVNLTSNQFVNKTNL